ncbi:MAG: 1-acyl-sn-glycerol-3-phosphate acyltransferase [Firmicutes bacterium]|nr:1-acyl-sn-glycerol-3-phosphate acyltransferase [Bacillota bacterium]
MNVKESILHVLLRAYYYSKFRFVINYINFNPKRVDPYILIGNHVSLHDGLYTSIHLKKYPYPVINVFMYTSWFMRFLLTKILYSIPKRKGQSDISTVKSMMNVIYNHNRGVMLFPEGNSSFFGKESDFPYSTVKFLKKMKLDIVVCKANGGYLSAPRWGKKVVNKGKIELNFYTLFKGKELETLSLDEIYLAVKEALKFNDFDWNRKNKYIYNSKSKAEGLESYIYVCPNCLNHQTIYTKENKIYCNHCGEIAHFNQYGLIEGLKFDNLVEWSSLQKSIIPTIVESSVKSKGNLFEVNLDTYKNKKLGKVVVVLENQILFIQNEKIHLEFNVESINGLVLTKKTNLSFDYENKTYYISLKDPMLFLDMINHLKGGEF